MTKSEINANGQVDEELADYLFDLNGFLILRQALAPTDLKEMNQWIDDHWSYVDDAARCETYYDGKWIGHVQTHSYSGPDGINFQNIVEGGPVFERLIDYPAWTPRIRRYINPTNGLSIHENLVNVRSNGGYIGIHCGGHCPISYLTFRQGNTGEWMVGQINLFMALTDIGPGDGATTVIPGSHRATTPHPKLAESDSTYRSDEAAGIAAGMQEVHLNAGDAVMFTDAITHGSTARTNPGHRRMCLYRYSPRWTRSRFNFIPSEGLLSRLSDEQRQIIQPIPPRQPPVAVAV